MAGYCLVCSVHCDAEGKPQGQRRFILGGVTFGLLCVALAACGGGATVASDPPSPMAGAYTLIITANDSSETQTLSLHLNVTP